MLPIRTPTTAISNGTVVAITLLVVASAMVMTAGAVTSGGQSPVAQQAEPDGFSGETNLSDAETELHGEAENDTAARSVASAGDVNGDGVDDLIVGAPHNDTGGQDAGAAYLVYGPADAAEVDLGDADVKLVGATTDDQAGWAVSHAGDVNDDGYADVVVGAPNNDTSGSNTGAAYVVYGNDSLPAEMNLGDADAVLQGTEADAHAGWSVSNATDGDGDDAVLVGSPYANDDAGAAYLVSGDEVNGTSALGDAAAATMEGESPGDRAGWSVSDAGDVNDDGTADVVVGAANWSGETNETASAGAAYVASSDVTGTVDLGSADLTLVGAGDRDRAGWSVSNAGDVNDDGVADVAVGAPYHDADAVNATGAAYVVYGGDDAEGERSLLDANRTLTGDREGDLAGWSVSGAGSADVTCDDVDDVLVGAPGHDGNGNDSGAAYVVAGDESAAEFQSLGDATAAFYGEATGDRAGHAVSAAGNVTDDGGADVVVGAPYNDSDGQTDAGAASLLASDCGDVTTETETPTDAETDTPLTETETETDTETATDTETDTVTETETEAPLTETETDTGTGTETETDTGTGTDTETDTDEVPVTDIIPPIEFDGCDEVRFYGVDTGIDLAVTAVSEDGQTESLTVTVDELQGTEGDQYFAVTTDDFEDEFGPVDGDWKIYTAQGQLNDNVEQNSQGQYTCAGAGNGDGNGDGGAGNQPGNGNAGLGFAQISGLFGFAGASILALRRRD